MNELSALGNTVIPLSVYLHGQQEQEENVDLEFIDEIFFSSAACVKNFSSLYRTIPEGITVATADSETETEYCRIFGKRPEAGDECLWHRTAISHVFLMQPPKPRGRRRALRRKRGNC